MNLIIYNIKKLEEIKNLLGQLTSDLYTHKKDIIGGATIGQHIRHILEFYIILGKGSESGTICYDDRDRNVILEEDLDSAIGSIEDIIHFLASIKADRQIKMLANYSITTEDQTIIQTSLYRELAYALDHTVHHLAIVKIALSNDKDRIILDNNFGVAPSTIRYRKEYVYGK